MIDAWPSVAAMNTILTPC